jgi:hypothetical protein
MNWLDVWSETARRQDDLIWAERERFIRQAEQQHTIETSAYQHWLARLGGWMVEWGCRLQTRYQQTLAVLNLIKSYLCNPTKSYPLDKRLLGR